MQNSSQTRQGANARLTQIQARLYQIGQEEKQLTDEARAIVGFLNLAQQEDKERTKAEQEEPEQVNTLA
jgi:hypothetical protein